MKKRGQKIIIIVFVALVVIAVAAIISNVVKKSYLGEELEGELATLLGEAELNISRTINSPNATQHYVTINIGSRADLNENELLLIAEEVPGGALFVENSWNVEPTFNFGDILVWLLAKNPPKYFGITNVSQPIPNKITYNVSGSLSGGIRGKIGLILNESEKKIPQA